MKLFIRTTIILTALLGLWGCASQKDTGGSSLPALETAVPAEQQAANQDPKASEKQPRIIELGNGLQVEFKKDTMVLRGADITIALKDDSRVTQRLTDVKTVIVEGGVNAIGERAFSDAIYKDIESFEIGDSVESIGPEAFSGCTSLNRVTFGKNLRAIEKRAFEGCEALKDIDLENSVESIEDYAFSGCTKLQTVRIGQSLM